jgi:hypothetical protein
MTVIVAGATMEFYVTQHKNWLMQGEVAEVQQNARACLDEIAGNLRMGGYRLDGHPAFTVGNDSLTVFFVDEATAQVDTILYFVDNSRTVNPCLYRKIKRQQPDLFGEDIESLVITNLNSRLLEIEITARSPKPDDEFIGLDGYRRRSYTTQVVLRNL